MEQVPEDFAVIMTTVGSREEADGIARALVEKRLSACTAVVPGIRSFYRWEGNINEDDEFLLLIKTRKGLFDQLSKAIRSIHSYECPEILMIPLTGGDPSYLSWLAGETA